MSQRGETINRSNFYHNSNHNNITTSASVNNVISLSSMTIKTNNTHNNNVNNSEFSYSGNNTKSLNKYK